MTHAHGDEKMSYKDELYHHGIKGQRWGVRRYQNPDGTLTPEGRRHQQQLQNELESGRVSKEQLEIELRESDKTNWNNALNKTISNINLSDYARRLSEAKSIAANLDNEAMTVNATMGFGMIPLGRGYGEVAIRQRELNEYANQYLSAHMDDFASAALNDLGYDDTFAGREYLKKLGILNWQV